MHLHRLLDLALLVSALVAPAEQREQKHKHKPKPTKQKGQYLNGPPTGVFDYIVLGSGPGGGPVACRLARAGFNTLLIEAGTDTSGYIETQIPSFHPQASELEAQVWQYFVQRHVKAKDDRRDYKFVWEITKGDPFPGKEYAGERPGPGSSGWYYATKSGHKYWVGRHPPEGAEPRGLQYNRGTAIGGSSQMSAMAMVKPWREDWEYIGEVTNNKSGWDPDIMDNYFVRLEDCHYIVNSAFGHGFKGWLSTSTTPLTLVLRDLKLLSLVIAIATALGKAGGLLGEIVKTLTGLANVFAADINAPGRDRDNRKDVYQVVAALNTNNGFRSGVVDFVHDTVAQGFPLTVATNTFATKILVDTNGTAPRAYGVQLQYGEHLHHASPLSTGARGVPGVVYAKNEVIVSCGAYETPKLLMLSGIGPPDELAAFEIPLIKDLPGVGSNMRDRYEVGVVDKASTPFRAFAACTYGYTKDDPCLKEFQSGNTQIERGPYTSNGLSIGVTFSSSVNDGPTPDCFIVGVPAYFGGYFPGYAKAAVLDAAHWTFVVLKLKSRNGAGTVKLLSTDPFDQPLIQFNQFAEGGDLDAQAVAEGIAYVREIYRDVIPLDGTFSEEIPGKKVEGAALTKFIKDNAWGHHVQGTCKLGSPDDPMAVVDGDFRVFGIDGLRIVDASLFPKPPGSYPTIPLYMMSEKAADVILGLPAKPLREEFLASLLEGIDQAGPVGNLASAVAGNAGNLLNPNVGAQNVASQANGLLGDVLPAKAKRWTDQAADVLRES